MQRNFTNFAFDVDREVMFMMLCDEVEEHVGSVQWFTRYVCIVNRSYQFRCSNSAVSALSLHKVDG